MDIIQQIMLVFFELLEKLRSIYDFVNSQFLPDTDIEEGEDKLLKK